jgi:hypothetical protein
VYGTVRTVVWEDGGREAASYPIVLGQHRGGPAGHALMGCLIMQFARMFFCNPAKCN